MDSIGKIELERLINFLEICQRDPEATRFPRGTRFIGFERRGITNLGILHWQIERYFLNWDSVCRDLILQRVDLYKYLKDNLFDWRNQ